MGLSPDLITNIAFGSVMFLIGLAGIWIVKWSTDRKTRASRHLDEENSIAVLPVRRTMSGETAVEASDLRAAPVEDPTGPGGRHNIAAELPRRAELSNLELLRSRSW